MPLRNRVTPLGELIATADRGLVYGNRGCLHNERGEIRRRFATKRWLACRLQFRGRRRSPLMAPGRYTELFFLDEATAFAAGHRPCAECRRTDYNRFCELWSALHPGARGADAIDDQLHSERVADGSGLRFLHHAPYLELPDGTFVMEDGGPRLVLGRQLLTWSPAGYRERRPRPANRQATVITPPSVVAILQRGWTSSQPFLHPTVASPPLGRATIESRHPSATPDGQPMRYSTSGGSSSDALMCSDSAVAAARCAARRCWSSSALRSAAS